MLTSLEVCAGAGGQALGLERAGFRHAGLVEIDHHACLTLKENRPEWPVARADIRSVQGEPGRLDLLAGGIPCPPFSVAGKQLGADDERDLFPEILRLTEEFEPRAVLIENVPGLMKPAFDDYRKGIVERLEGLGYGVPGFRVLNAKDFEVPQLRPRVVLVALRPEYVASFQWPEPHPEKASTVGEALLGEMSSRGWEGAEEWAANASTVAPTLVGGSKKHGGPDLGPTRARQAWASLGVDGGTLAEEPPAPGHVGMPRLTVRMCGIIQGFPAGWSFSGRKTQAYRQVGNAFPPPVAEAIGASLSAALTGVRTEPSEDAA